MITVSRGRWCVAAMTSGRDATMTRYSDMSSGDLAALNSLARRLWDAAIVERDNQLMSATALVAAMASAELDNRTSKEGLNGGDRG